MIKKIIFLFLSLVTVVQGDTQAALEAPVILQNDVLQVTIEPRWGGRASSVRSLVDNREFVAEWGEVKERRGAKSRLGGIFRGIMSGSYVSEQAEEPYTVLENTSTRIRLAYENPYSLMKGLREEKTIQLDGADIICTIKVTNTSEENRTIFYRMQDWLNVVTGSQILDTIYVVPKNDSPLAFRSSIEKSFERHFIHPNENWYALMDVSLESGLLVTSDSQIQGIYFWGSESSTTKKTSEMFYPRIDLAPAESWSTVVTYTVLSKERQDSRLTKEMVQQYLEKEKSRIHKGEAPYHATTKNTGESEAVCITSVHAGSVVAIEDGNLKKNTSQTLDKISLAGTPGEVVSFAFVVSAKKEVKDASVLFSEKTSSGWLSGAFQSHYVSGDSLILVNDWKLSRNIPLETISHINNDVKDADELTPFSLKADQNAWVWVNVRIPENADAGNYTAQCTINTGGYDTSEFQIDLKVRNFKLQQASHKNYGTFFRYYLDPKSEKKNTGLSPYYIDQPAFLEALRTFADIGVRSLAIYAGKREEVLWILDESKKLGMDGEFILIIPHQIKPVDLASREITAYGWTTDEPSRYAQIPELFKRYETVNKLGMSPVFTPNLPLGIILADQMEEMVPVFNTNGNAPYLQEITRNRKEAGKSVYWYECYGLAVPSVEQRAIRGIYLWKEPVDGIYDWDHGSMSPNLKIHHLVGFAGTKLLPRLGLENIRQGLIDLRYLHTLEILTKNTSDSELRAEAQELMDWIRTTFDSDYHDVMPYIQTSQYLDEVREKVAVMIEKLISTPKNKT